MKKLRPVILISIVSAIIFSLVSFWVSEFEYSFLGYLILAGFFIVWVQKETAVSKFLIKLIVGSLLFGFLTLFLIFLRIYALSHLVYDAPLPFRELWDKDFLMMALVFTVVSFLGGLVGIVLKGLHVLYGEKLDKAIIFVGPIAAVFSSLAIYKIKIGGTIMSSLHGWPYYFWVYQIKDVLDGFSIDRWIFSPGSLYHYLVFNYLLYFVIFIPVYFLIVFANKRLKTRKINTTFVLFGVLAVMILALTSFLSVKKSYISYQISWAKECVRSSDCEIIANRSPFSCAVVVNKGNTDRILGLLDSFPSTGELQCSGNEKAVCLDGRCRVSNDYTPDKTNWELVEQAIRDCDVSSIMQTHALEVTVVLKNGEVVKAKEPKIDDVFDIVNQFREKCGEIRMATE